MCAGLLRVRGVPETGLWTQDIQFHAAGKVLHLPVFSSQVFVLNGIPDKMSRSGPFLFQGFLRPISQAP